MHLGFLHPVGQSSVPPAFQVDGGGKGSVKHLCPFLEGYLPLHCAIQSFLDFAFHFPSLSPIPELQ